MRLRSRKDKVLCCQFKKRHLKDLDAEEAAKLIEATKEPYRIQKDVAKQFHVSEKLVSRLVTKHRKEPEFL